MKKLMTPVFRVAFPSVFVPTAPPGSDKRQYSVTMLFTPANFTAEEKVLWAEIKKAAAAVATEKWPKELPKGLMSPFRDGVEKQEYDGFGAGVVFVRAATKDKPGVIDMAKNKIEDQEDFYGGCYARATINPSAWTYLGKHGVKFWLNNIQKVREGEPFGGRTRATDDFSAAEETPAATSGLFD
jgi:hypothetical protein